MELFKWRIVLFQKVNGIDSFVFIHLDIIFFLSFFFTDPCLAMPCGPHGRCLALTAAPHGYMCMCQSDGLTFTTIDTCPSNTIKFIFFFLLIFLFFSAVNSFCTHMTCKNGGTCIPFSETESACAVGQIGSTCCLCNQMFFLMIKTKHKQIQFYSF